MHYELFESTSPSLEAVNPGKLSWFIKEILSVIYISSVVVVFISSPASKSVLLPNLTFTLSNTEACLTKLSSEI